MTAAEYAEQACEQHPLLRGASPGVIRDRLFPEDRNEFVVAYDAALAEARRTFDLTPVYETVEQYRSLAIAQSDPEGFRRSIRQWAELSTGATVPDDEPFEITRRRVGM